MYVIKFKAPTRGLFAVFIEAIRCIDFAVSNHMEYFVDLSESDSLYTDVENKNGDKNIWNYYFVQPQNANTAANTIYSAGKYEGNTDRIWLRSHFERVYNNAIKNLRFTAEVENAFSDINKKFIANTLGVHIRRTDHHLEVPPVSLETYISEMNKKLAQKKFQNIFLATDDEGVLEVITKQFSNYNIIYNNVTRSATGAPVHKSGKPSDGFRLGLEALEDVYSLSLCSDVILTNSNFSYCVLYFNPSLQYTLLDGFNAKTFSFWYKNFSLNRRYNFFHKASMLRYYRKWNYFKKNKVKWLSKKVA